MEPLIDRNGPPHTEKTVGAAEWLSTHLYTSACVGAGILLVIGALIVKTHLPASTTNTLKVWGGGQGTLINPTGYDQPNPVLTNTSAGTGLTNTNSISFTPIPVTRADTADTSGDGFDIQAWAALIAGPAKPSGSNTTGGASVDSSYEFIPQGLMSTSSSERPRTAMQQSLYEYGNNAGSYIQTYEDAHQNTAPVLKDQSIDRQNAQKGQAVKDIGQALKEVGVSLEHMDGVPESAQALNQGLARAYIDIGEKLSAIPDAIGDDGFIQAIKTYNASVDVFTKRFVALAQFLSLSGVTFSSIDPGSVFTFSGGGSL